MSYRLICLPSCLSLSKTQKSQINPHLIISNCTLCSGFSCTLYAGLSVVLAGRWPTKNTQKANKKLYTLLRIQLYTIVRIVLYTIVRNIHPDCSFDFAVFVTSICLIDNPGKALAEAHRIIRNNGDLIVAFIDKDSSLGKSPELIKKESKFYEHAKFYSVNEMTSMIVNSHFETTEIIQTLIKRNSDIPENQVKGYSKGSFVVIKGKKK